MSQELMNLIHEKCRYIRNVRNVDGYIWVQMPYIFPDSEMSWIPKFQAPKMVEEIIDRWLMLGGKLNGDNKGQDYGM